MFRLSELKKQQSAPHHIDPFNPNPMPSAPGLSDSVESYPPPEPMSAAEAYSIGLEIAEKGKKEDFDQVGNKPEPPILPFPHSC